LVREDDDIDSLVKKVDEPLYIAKANGKDRFIGK